MEIRVHEKQRANGFLLTITEIKIRNLQIERIQ